MSEKALPYSLKNQSSFSRQEFVKEMERTYRMTTSQIDYDLRKRIRKREIVRKGWGEYSVASSKKEYIYQYSDLSKEIADQLNNEYFDLNFRIFELVQLNAFLNHQMAHNTYFVYVENDFVDAVFDLLFRTYPGKVMLKPDADHYFRYLLENEIVVLRLPSESPKGYDEPWHIKIEQILVETMTSKLMSQILPESEQRNLLGGAFSGYLVDEKTMIRYAKRKGTEKKVRAILEKYEGLGTI